MADLIGGRTQPTGSPRAAIYFVQSLGSRSLRISDIRLSE
jgi:hypothetical protein